MIAWLTDGLVWFLAGAAVLGLLLRRVTRDDPPWVAWALLAVVAVGAAWRLALSPVAPLTAWPYARIVPLAGRIFAGPALGVVSAALDRPLALTDVIAATNGALACLTPLALFTFARLLFADARAAVAAAALLATLPLHVRFSRSDVYFVQSLALVPLVLALAWTALVDPDRRWRAAAAVALVPLAAAAFASRPLAVLHLPLALWLVLAVVRDRAPGRRRAAVAALLVAAAAPAVHAITTFQASQVGAGLGAETLANVVRVLGDPAFVPVVDPAATPPVVPLLAVAGAILLWRAPRGPARALLLVAWLGGYLLAHAYVVPAAPLMQARYHLDLALPLVLLAAPALGALATPVGRGRRPGWRRAALAVAVLWLAAAPGLHRGFVRDVAFDTQREHAFLVGLREVAPRGCVVLEYQGPEGARVPSRVGRIGAEVLGGGRAARWRVVPTGTAEAAAVLADPPACLLAYEGLTCWSETARDEPFAGPCAALHERATLTPIATAGPFAPRVYDRNMARGYGPRMSPLQFTLYEVVDGRR